LLAIKASVNKTGICINPPELNMAKPKSASNKPVYLKNKPATFEYAIEDKLTAGIVLTGSEIKSIRLGKVSFNDSYCFFFKDELWIRSLHIAEYVNAGYAGHDPIRERKLLLNKKEIKKWLQKIKEKGFTIVPLSIYINENGYAKLDIGLGRGKKIYDKRESIKNREAERSMKNNDWKN
jgi:SsrA-binding protein